MASSANNEDVRTHNLLVLCKALGLLPCSADRYLVPNHVQLLARGFTVLFANRTCVSALHRLQASTEKIHALWCSKQSKDDSQGTD